MSYLHDKQKKQKRISIIAIAIIVLVLSFFSVSVARGGASMMQYIARPFWKAHTVARDYFEGILEGSASKKTLLSENTELKASLELQKQSVLDRDALALENKELKDLFLHTEHASTKLLSSVLVRPPVSPYDTVVIDVGEKDGVMIGDLVFLGDTVVLGTITDIYKNSSVVHLYTYPGLETQAFVSNMTVTLVGRGGGNFEITLPKDVELELGAPIVLPNFETVIIGTIGAKISKPNDPYTRYLARGSQNFNEIRFVTVKK